MPHGQGICLTAKEEPHGYLVQFNVILRVISRFNCNQSGMIKFGYESNKATRPRGAIIKNLSSLIRVFSLNKSNNSDSS